MQSHLLLLMICLLSHSGEGAHTTGPWSIEASDGDACLLQTTFIAQAFFHDSNDKAVLTNASCDVKITGRRIGNTFNPIYVIGKPANQYCSQIARLFLNEIFSDNSSLNKPLRIPLRI